MDEKKEFRENKDKENLKKYVLKDDDFGERMKAQLAGPLQEALGKVAAELLSRNIAERHKEETMTRRVHKKLLEKEKKKQQEKEDLKAQMGEDYEEEEEPENKDEDEDSFLDEEEKEFFDAQKKKGVNIKALSLDKPMLDFQPELLLGKLLLDISRAKKGASSPSLSPVKVLKPPTY